MAWDAQLAVVAAIVGLAVAYIGRSAWKTLSGKKAGCGSGCGKCATDIPPEEKGRRFPLPQA